LLLLQPTSTQYHYSSMANSTVHVTTIFLYIIYIPTFSTLVCHHQEWMKICRELQIIYILIILRISTNCGREGEKEVGQHEEGGGVVGPTVTWNVKDIILIIMLAIIHSYCFLHYNRSIARSNTSSPQSAI